MRWGLVGTGPWAQRVHGPSLHTNPDLEFVSVWGRNSDAAAMLAGDFGVQHRTSFAHLLDEVDAVSFAVPPSIQPELALQAIRAGRHVLLEKPAAQDASLVVELNDAATRHGTRAAVFMTRLFDHSRQQWISGCVGGSFDKAEVLWISGALNPGSPFATSSWRHGAGIVWDVFPHILAQIEPVMGPVTDVTVRDWPEQQGIRVLMSHGSGKQTNANVTLRGGVPELVEHITFASATDITCAPAAALDYRAAHTAASNALSLGSDWETDPVLRLVTLHASVALTATLQAIADQIPDVLEGTPSHERS
jgi:predicted dehydrogenase